MTAQDLYVFILSNGPRTVRQVARSKGIRQSHVHDLAMEHPWIKILASYEEGGVKIMATSYGDCKLVVDHRQNVAN